MGLPQCGCKMCPSRKKRVEKFTEFLLPPDLCRPRLARPLSAIVYVAERIFCESCVKRFEPIFAEEKVFVSHWGGGGQK
jgi:hypothetical protein